MTEEVASDLDAAVAAYLIKPSSRTALNIIREARRVEMASDQDEVSRLARAHKEDCLRMHDAVLTLESDPEIVRRNMAARVISGVFPVLNSLEQYRGMEDPSLWDLVLNGFGIISEIATSTQYLESTRLTAGAHNERALVEIEERFFRLSMETGGGMEEKSRSVEEFLDRVRELEVPTREKPFVPFVLWTLIMILSYKQLKESC